ncbi:MAG: TrmH family RNA methyltransferase [Acidimicrobiales bacterium]
MRPVTRWPHRPGHPERSRTGPARLGREGQPPVSSLDALSPRNPRLSEVRRLLNSPSARREHRRFVVEGPRLLAEALAASWQVIEVFVEDPAAWPAATLVRAGTLDRLGDAVTSQGVLAVVAAPALGLSEASPQGSLPTAATTATVPRTVLVLVDVADPGNAGTILRTAAAAGVAAVIFAGHSVDPLSPKVVRASAGSLFRVPVAVAPDLEDVFSWAHRSGLAVWATVPDHHANSRDLYATDLDGAVALLLGSEAHGLNPAVLARVGPRMVAVPTVGGVESLNVAMAATVVAFELFRRQRVTAGPGPNRLDAPMGAGQASGHDR